MSHNMSNDMSDEWYNFFDECQIVLKIKDIREKNKQVDGLEQRVKELEQQLKELPKKICDKIKEISEYNVDDFGGEWLEIDLDSLNEIEEEYIKEQEDERD